MGSLTVALIQNKIGANEDENVSTNGPCDDPCYSESWCNRLRRPRIESSFCEMWNKIDTILTHTGILVDNVLLPITVQIAQDINFPIEVGTISFTDPSNCPSIPVDETLSALQCSSQIRRGGCLVSRITAVNNGVSCIAFEDTTGSTESQFLIRLVGSNNCN